MAYFENLVNNECDATFRHEEATSMARHDFPGSSLIRSRSTRGSLFWVDLCTCVRRLVAQTNRSAGETVLCDERTSPTEELLVHLPYGPGFKLAFVPERDRVMCEFPHCPNFNRKLELSANTQSHSSKAVWTDLQTGLPVSNDELAGDLVRNLLIMTSDTA
ncbi:MAG: hypothetical protein KGL64_12400 [Acidobacteriota bacterium]|nr:hypothetical protein [Acidobacteriota bacterium]